MLNKKMVGVDNLLNYFNIKPVFALAIKNQSHKNII